jgi:enoyl-CoA hydratase/carnithine racemase
MTNSDQVLIRSEEGVLEVILNRPEKYNAITGAMLDRLREAINLFASDRSLRVMRLGATGKYFTAGMEIGPEIAAGNGDSTLDGRHWYRTKFHSLFDEFEAVEKPIVATHQGICLGGGLELSLSCDFRLAAASTRYGLPEIDIGALPGSGGISRLTRLCGPHWTRWLVMAGEQVTAEQAVSIGFVHAVYPDEEFEARASAFCRKLAKQPYEVMGLAKLSIELATDLDRAQARNVERISNSILFTGAEHKTLVQAFMDRQAAKRKQRKDS